MKELESIPLITDHRGYSGCLERVAELEQKLAAAKNELTALGNGPRAGAESHDDEDIEKGVALHLRELEAHQKASVKAQLRIAALERALRIEKEKIPELRFQAEEMVGRAAAAQYEKTVERLMDMRTEMDQELKVENAIRIKLRQQLSSALPGGDGSDWGERYVRGIAMSHVIPGAAANVVISQAEMNGVMAGQQRFKREVYEPKEKEWRGLSERFTGLLSKFLGKAD